MDNYILLLKDLSNQIWKTTKYWWPFFVAQFDTTKAVCTFKCFFIFYYGHLSSAQLDRWQAPTQWPIINQHPVERHIKERSKTMNSWLVRQRNRSWIKGLGKNQQKEWTRSLLGEPYVRGHRTVTPWTQRNDCVYSQAPRWRVDKAPAKSHKNWNAIRRSKTNCIFIWPPMWTG